MTSAETTRGSYRVLGGSQDLLDHHAVPGERAAVECVGPIRTEGAEATCYHATQRRGQRQTKGKGTQHRTKNGTSITTCNLQGNSLFWFYINWTEEIQTEEAEELRVGEKSTAGYSEMEMRAGFVCLH